MRTADDYEAIRKLYYLSGLSVREMAPMLHNNRRLIRKAIAKAEPDGYRLTKLRPAPVLAPYKPKIEEMLDENHDAKYTCLLSKTYQQDSHRKIVTHP